MRGDSASKQRLSGYALASWVPLLAAAGLIAADVSLRDEGGANIGLGAIGTLLLIAAGALAWRGIRETSMQKRGRPIAVASLTLVIVWVLLFLVLPSLWLVFDSDFPIDWL